MFFGPIRKPRWLPGPPIGWYIFTSLLNGIRRNLTGMKISTSSTKFVFFERIGKSRWPPWPLIGWHIFNFSLTAKQNSTKLDGKQDLHIFYRVCIFLADRKTRGPKSHNVISCTRVQYATFWQNDQGGHFCILIDPKNINLVEDVEILLPVKFRWIPFNGFREVENVSANPRPARQSCFSDRTEKHKLGRGQDVEILLPVKFL